MNQLRYIALRLLEGYWSWPFNFIGKPMVAFHQWNFQRLQNRWNLLKSQEDKGILTADGRREMSELEKRLHYYPTEMPDFLPTSLGNALRSGEDAPYYKYGLDALTCWPRVWPLLPAEIQEDLSTSRQRLDSLVVLFIWGFLFITWAWWWHWAILIGLAWMVTAYSFAVQSAIIYSDLVESIFDTHRFELYMAAHWPLPKESGKDEVSAGKQLTEFLWRGTSANAVKFIHPKD